MDASERHVKLEIRPSSVALWTGVLAGPVAWVADLQARFALVHDVCENHAGWIMWLITLAALVATGFGALCSWRGWIDDTPRVRFMAIGGLMISGLFAIAVVAMVIPDLFMRACD